MDIQKLIADTQPLATIVISIAGGVTSFVMDREYTCTRFIVSIVTAGFAGYLVFLIGVECGLKENMISILCGVSGLSGETVVRLIKKISVECIKQKINKITNKETPK